MVWNATACESEYAELAEACGIDGGANGLISAVKRLNAVLGIPNDLTSSGLTEQHFQFIVENCRSRSMSGNPRQMSDEDVLHFLNNEARS